jgi:hypothetical protein
MVKPAAIHPPRRSAAPGFASLPPTQVRALPEGYIPGGLMQTGEPDFTALIVFDLRSLALTSAQGRALEADLRKFTHDRLARMGIDLRNCASVDLGQSVFGIAFD